MFQFGPESMKVGGLVRIPHSLIDSAGFGKIKEASKLGITVVYFHGTTREQTCFYRYEWLQDKYGPKKALPAPANEAVVCKECNRFTRFCQCAEDIPNDPLPI